MFELNPKTSGSDFFAALSRKTFVKPFEVILKCKHVIFHPCWTVLSYLCPELI